MQTDPTAFYSYDEYLTAVKTLYEVVSLRAQSIQGQLYGTIPSTQQEQRDSDALVDASHIDLSVMGSMDMGGGRGGEFSFGDMDFEAVTPFANGRDQASALESGGGSASTKADTTSSSQSMSQTPAADAAAEGTSSGENVSENDPPTQIDAELPEPFDPSQFSGELPEGVDPSGFSGQEPGNFAQPGATTEDAAQSPSPESDESDGSAETGKGQQPPNMENMPGRGELFGAGIGQAGSACETIVLYYGAAAGVMIAAFLFAAFYRRRPRKR